MRNRVQAWIMSLPSDKQILPFVIVMPTFIIGTMLFFLFATRRDFKKLREMEDKEMSGPDTKNNP